MIDSGRFTPTRDEAEPVFEDPVTDDALPPVESAATEKGLAHAISQSTLFDLGQIDVR